MNHRVFDAVSFFLNAEYRNYVSQVSKLNRCRRGSVYFFGYACSLLPAREVAFLYYLTLSFYPFQLIFYKRDITYVNALGQDLIACLMTPFTG